MKKYLFSILPTLLVIILILSCSNKQDQIKTILLARIGSKSISKNEFIRRAEYTIRPVWCRGDNYMHQKIALNSLIAEKLLALEAGEDNKLARNEEFQLYMKGRKEQAMRQWLFQKKAVEKVKPDTAKINLEYRISARTYKISFINIPGAKLARSVYHLVNDKKEDFEEVAKELSGESNLAQREIAWQNAETRVVHEALFRKDVKKNQIIGPLQLEKNQYIIMRVDGWISRPLLSDQKIKQRWNDVKEKLTQDKALLIYQEYLARLMKGKDVQFNGNTFEKLVNILGKDYYKSDKEKKKTFNSKFWNRDRDEMILDDPQNELKKIMDSPLLTHDGKTWKVADFLEAITVHPLVFRKKRMPKGEFGEQFKLAIVDMIRAQHVTKQAYKEGFDKADAVERNYSMWKDNLLALYQKNKILADADIKGQSTELIVKKYLDPHIKELQKKHSANIEINTDTFEKIKLTNVDMFVIQKNVSFPVIVPSFPQMTTLSKLDYGKKMGVE